VTVSLFDKLGLVGLVLVGLGLGFGFGFGSGSGSGSGSGLGWVGWLDSCFVWV